MDPRRAQSDILRSMELLATRATVGIYAPGEVIFKPGEERQLLYGVLEGLVGLAWADGLAPEQLGPGQVFGDVALAQPVRVRMDTATALAHSRILLLDRTTMLFAMEALPMFGLEVLASLEARLSSAHQPPRFP